jgi:hypothetical protein
MSARRKYPLEFHDGERVDAARLTVIKRPEVITDRYKAVYEVKFDCCGNVGKITRDGIISRIREDVKLCQVCNAHRGGNFKAKKAAIKNGKPGRGLLLSQRLLPEGVTPPLWKPPKLSISLSSTCLMSRLR